MSLARVFSSLLRSTQPARRVFSIAFRGRPSAILASTRWTESSTHHVAALDAVVFGRSFCRDVAAPQVPLDKSPQALLRLSVATAATGFHDDDIPCFQRIAFALVNDFLAARSLFARDLTGLAALAALNTPRRDILSDRTSPADGRD